MFLLPKRLGSDFVLAKPYCNSRHLARYVIRQFAQQDSTEEGDSSKIYAAISFQRIAGMTDNQLLPSVLGLPYSAICLFRLRCFLLSRYNGLVINTSSSSDCFSSSSDIACHRIPEMEYNSSTPSSRSADPITRRGWVSSQISSLKSITLECKFPPCIS